MLDEFIKSLEKPNRPDDGVERRQHIINHFKGEIIKERFDTIEEFIRNYVVQEEMRIGSTVTYMLRIRKGKGDIVSAVNKLFNYNKYTVPIPSSFLDYAAFLLPLFFFGESEKDHSWNPEPEKKKKKK